MVALLGVVGLLAVGDRERSAPAPTTTTSTSAPARESPQLRWSVAGEPGYYSSGSVRALDRDRTVVRLRRIAPGDEGGGSLMQVDHIQGRVGESLRLSADLKVEGPGEAGVWMRIASRRLVDGGRLEELASASTPEGDEVVAGGWDRRSVELVVPEEAGVVTYGIYLRGAGSVYVDEVEEP